MFSSAAWAATSSESVRNSKSCSRARLARSARHRGDARALRRRSGRSRRLRRGGGQSQCFAHFGIQLGHGVFVVFEELAGIFAALPDALAFIAEPRTRLFEDVVVHGDVEQ